MELAPNEIQTIAANYGAEEVFFVDDRAKCTNSVRFHQSIFINARCTFWGNMIPPPLCCNNTIEAIELRILHEMAHIHLNHKGDTDIASTPGGLVINRNKDPFVQNFGGHEGEVWEFALGFRAQGTDEYKLLNSACEAWYTNHVFAEKDWNDSKEDQWRRLHQIEYRESDIQIPEWVRNKYAPYMVRA